MSILLFLCIFFEQFNIEKFKMRPRRTIQNSTFKIQKAAAILADRPQPENKKIL